MNKIDQILQIEKKEKVTFESIKDSHQMRQLTQGLNKHFLLENDLIPIAVDRKGVFVGALKYNLKVFDELQIYFDKPIRFVPITAKQLSQCFSELMPKANPKTHTLNSEDFFSDLLQKAIEQSASDIHIEPNEKGFIIRFRVDGMMHEHFSGDISFFQRVVSHIKILAKLDIAEHRLPQDGRVRKELKDRVIDLRVSVLPVYGGQRVVLRILDQSKTLLNLKQIMLGEIEDDFKQVIRKSEGILLVTGPTGSGKTTTLYSVLDHLNHQGVNIMTIEDPIEYRINGINQLGVRPKINLDFAKGLRHILRQDPDVILIGEIRDKETAQIAIQASLTGHLVLSTLHTNDAASAVTRLVEMGIERYLVASSLIGVLAQRLVRVICNDCKTSYAPTSQELADLSLNVALVSKGTGCEHCFETGYVGRRAIFEWLKVDEVLRKEMMQDVQSSMLHEVATKRGMQTLKTNGAKLVRSGITSPSEVMRVLG